MKKLMIAMMATIVAICAKATLTLESSESEFRTVADAMLTATDAAAAIKIAKDEKFFYISNKPALADFRASYDARLAEKFRPATKKKSLPVFPLHTWPTVAELACEVFNVPATTPYIYAKAKELGVQLEPVEVASAGGFEVCIGVLNEMIAKRDVYFDIHRTVTALDNMNRVKRVIQKKAEASIKKWLRRQGKSFVTKDGVNPCAERMTALNAALNAPRFAELNEWMADLGLECRIDVASLPSSAEVEALKEKVLDGDETLDADKKIILFVCLGVDGYNQFVKEYNGDK